MRVRVHVAALVLSAVFLLLPGIARAQSGIAGTVKDDQGGVMPGVTVEAASPVLIEKVRSAISDGSGRYTIIDLRPGTYTVTFSLPGFATVVREGINLPTSFTATVDAEMRVGGLEETINVSGQTPLVDLQSATQQVVLSKELMEAVPTGRNLWGVGATMNGVTLSSPDVGGTAGMQQSYMAVHGSDRRDNSIQIDGMIVNGIEGDGAIQNYFNQGMFEEMSYQTSALGSEVQGSGVRLNMIPRDGSNQFKGSLFWSHTPGAWQSDNFTDELKATGLRAPNRVERIFDFNPGLGGPILKDKIWFYGTFRRWGVDQTITETFYNQDTSFKTFVPDLSRPVVDDNVIKSGALRSTFVIAQKHKFAAYLDRIQKFRGHECPALSAEERCGIRSPKRYFTAQAKYTGTITSRLLLEVGWSENDETYSTNEAQPTVRPENISKSDRATGETWGAPNGPYYFRVPDRHTIMTQASYVTGSHNVRVGMTYGFGGNRHQRVINGNWDLLQEYNTIGGVARQPQSVIVFSTPQEAAEKIKYDTGIYLQDTYTRNRLTITPGIRFELFNTYIPAQASNAGRFVPGRSFDKIENVPNWRDVAPRFGAVYDVFGNGKTAIKGHVGKYMVAFSTVGFAAVYNPMVIQTDRRTWSDLNGDDIAQNNEIGPVVVPFNVSGASNRTPADGIRRPYQWETGVSVQHELFTGLSLTAGWVRRDYKRLFWTDNVAVDPSDYTQFSVANPVFGNAQFNGADATIPIYTLSAAARARTPQFVDKNSSQNRRLYDGVDVGFTARIKGGNLYGGTSIGRQLTVNCEVEDPNSLRYCDQRDLNIPYLSQFKLAGSYPLPFKLQLSGSLQAYSGAASGSAFQDANYDSSINRITDTSQNLNYVVTNAIFSAANPGQTLRSFQGSNITVPLLQPGQNYLKRWNQVDVRLARKFQVGRYSLQGQFDMFNVLNSSSIINQNQSFGSAQWRPTQILQGRLIALGMQLNF
ncbi:MAG: carboxypeptidase regulatory-like domain-containing protein [Vicinamibacterales bacterium]